MFCTNCGKAIEADTKFCPHCGARQTAEPAPASPPPAQAHARVMAATESRPQAPARGGKTALWAGAGALVLAMVGGAGYWGWSNKVAGDEAAQKLAVEEQARKTAAEDAARQLADEAQRRVDAAEKAADAAEVTAAQAQLDRHIAAEEAQAQANAQAAQGQAKPKAAAVRR